jgi:hypothetical protein
MGKKIKAELGQILFTSALSPIWVEWLTHVNALDAYPISTGDSNS